MSFDHFSAARLGCLQQFFCTSQPFLESLQPRSVLPTNPDHFSGVLVLSYILEQLFPPAGDITKPILQIGRDDVFTRCNQEADCVTQELVLVMPYANVLHQEKGLHPKLITASFSSLLNIFKTGFWGIYKCTVNLQVHR